MSNNYEVTVAAPERAAEAQAAAAQAAQAALEAEQAAEAVQPAPVVYTAPAPVIDTGDAKAFIYSHESGNVPCKINGGSVNCGGSSYLACGLGQALPCSKLLAVCPDLSDYACQDTWFTNNYMIPRYGTWAAAKAFWLANGWW